MVKKKTNPLNKRFLRELKSEAGKYIVLFVFIAGVIALVSGFLVASGSMSQAYDESFEKYNIEDGNFEVKREASSGLLDALQKDGTKIYPNFYKEEQTKNVESTLRIFKKRTEIDLECLMEGSFPEDENEIAIDRMYAVNNKIYVNVDPTLLLSSKEWDKIADEVEFSNYIFVYPVGVSKKMIDFAKKIAKKNNWKVVYLDRNLKWHDPEVTFLQIAGPSQFIGLIRNANMVVTNSFHGAVFSIIYHKQLYVEFKENGNGNARVQNLMTLLGVPKHAMERLNPNDDYPNDEDWDKIDNNILKERKHAMEYLKNALE